MAQPQEFPFNIMDVAELLHLHIRRRQADSVYADCPICGDKRGKMNINFAKNLWRCNYCNEGGGMLALYGKVYGISNSEAYREICDTLQNGLTAPEYTVKELPEKVVVEQSALASPQEIHQTFSMLLELLTLSPQHRKHLQEVRGLTDEQIERLGYKSTPPFYLCRSLTEKLRSRGCKVEGVPGFYVGKDDKWTVNFNSITAGIIIPARGIDGMIRGAQIRLDTPIRDQESDPDKSGTKYLWLSSSSKKRGVSSGSPVHFVGDPFARVVYVTEGLLKADVAHYLMDRSFAATAGANNVNKLDMLFALLAANGTEVIIEAEDMDKYHMLKDAHDSAAKTLKDKRTAEQEKAIGDSFDEWQKRYQYQSKELMMIPPHSAKEIVDEGAALHHCVGHYLKNVAEKERVILFVRSVAEPDKSLCTVEVKDGQVTQARGFDNAEPPAQITAFIEQWKHRVLYASDKAAA